ncbi:SET and MYND domain containing class 3 [Carabus blaptoides fortunei]
MPKNIQIEEHHIPEVLHNILNMGKSNNRSNQCNPNHAKSGPENNSSFIYCLVINSYYSAKKIATLTLNVRFRTIHTSMMRTKEQTNVKQGTIIHTEKPFVHILNSKLRSERCEHCFHNKKLLKCSGCQYVHYCGRECQKDSWSIHKYECANLRRVSPRIVPDAARLLGRLIIKLRNGGDMQKGFYTQTKFRKFKDLMSHYSNIKEDNVRMEHFTSLYGVLHEYLQDTPLPNTAELLGIYGRMCINGFTILDAEMTSIGTGIYLGASVIDHSCKPNALAVFEGTTIYIRTTEALAVFDWSQIFISYTDVLNTPEDRQKELLATYYFVCQCQLCLDNSLTRHMHSATCPNTVCSALITMTTDRETDVIRCDVCAENITKDFIRNYRDAIEYTEIHLQDMRNMAYLDICRMCLQKQQGFLSSINLMHVKTLDLAFESSIQMGLWDDAEEFGIRMIPGFRKYYGDFHPLLGLLYLKIGKILLYKKKSLPALEYLQEAQIILSVTHGPAHSLYKESFVPLMRQVQMECSLSNNN